MVTADHGHLFGESLGRDRQIPAPGGETVALHRRAWVGRGGADPAMKASAQRAVTWLQSNAATFGLTEALAAHDIQVEYVDLLGNRVAYEPAVGTLVAIVSAFRKVALLPALVVAGDMTLQGNLRAPRSVVECMETARSNGGRRVLIPSEARRSVMEAPADLVDAVDPLFFGDLTSAVQKALGLK